MLRRVHVSRVAVGRVTLDADAAHHLHNVLRIQIHDEVELFDDAGRSAIGTVVNAGDGLAVDVIAVRQPIALAISLTIASVVPKGDRADWMIEKLSELGVTSFVPLHADRSVVLPTGVSKVRRWERIAIESAKQSRRQGVMAIGPLTPVATALAAAGGVVCVASTAEGVSSSAFPPSLSRGEVTVFIGPEGGWTDAELQRFEQAGGLSIKLTATVLRIETAAVVAAAVILCR